MVGIGAIVVSVIVAVGAAFAFLGGGSDDAANVAELPESEEHPVPLDANKQTADPPLPDTTATKTVPGDGIVENPEPATTSANDSSLAPSLSEESTGETEKAANLAEPGDSPSPPVVAVEQNEPPDKASPLESRPVPTQPAPAASQVRESPTSDKVAVEDVDGARETAPATDVVPSRTAEAPDFLGARGQPETKVARADIGLPKPANMAPDAAQEIPVQEAEDKADIQPAAIPRGQPTPETELRRKKLLTLFEQRKQLVAAFRAVQAEIATIKQKNVATNATLDKAKLNRLAVEQRGQEAVGTRSALLRDFPNARNSPQMAKLNLEIQNLTRQAAILEQQMVTCQNVLRVLPNELRVATAKAVESRKKCDQFSAKWTEVHDPFGRLSPADQRMTVELCTDWLASDPDFPSAYLMRGFAQLHLGELNKAQADFSKIIDQGKASQLSENEQTIIATALSGRGWVHTEMNQEKEAMADLAGALDRRPKSALPYIVRGRAYSTFGRNRSALDDYVKATKLDEKEPAGYREASWLLATSPTLRDGPRAVRFGRTACELTEWRQWRCLDTYAIASAAAGGFEEAVKWATRAVEIAPAEVREELEHRLKLFRADAAPTSLKRL